MQEDTFSNFSSNPHKNVHRPQLIGIVFACLFLVIIILIGLYVFGATTKRASTLLIPTLTPAPEKNEATPTVVPTAIPTVSVTGSPRSKLTPSKSGPTTKPTISPTPAKGASKLDRSSLHIAVLNGSGVAGAAKTISSYLGDLGYTIKVVGNAKRFDYTDLTIHVSKAKSAYLPMLEKDLMDKSSNISASISDDVSADAEVIVGK